ncbi:redoxin domain-containing protein [bacterium]|nr:redoxin domain-containing protein [bacterium]MDB4466019.1 redoxin domain-containing protein [Akkermansiaceae bacterium]MDB4572832.1 redoxin domain-containing protein [Akkermansiaceae bacterium]MDB4809416.1 redoxin domain-containing protein [bacterium]
MRFLFVTCCAIGSLLAYKPTPLTEGEKAPDFKLPGVDGREYSLKDFSGADALAVIFTTNHCPDAIASHGRMVALVNHFKGQPVKFVAINSNSPEGLHLPELGWTVYDDSFEDMKLIAKDSGFNLPYLYDGNTQEVAKAYGAVATPHVFIFDKDLKLRYNGRMDNGRRRVGPVEKNEARDAISAILEGKKIEVVKTRPVGCTTKWKEKAEMVAGEDRKWKAQPVTVAKADAATLAKLVANKGRTGMRLINLWSTSCGPCVAEFPELVKIYRQYSWQEFEFIPISLDPVGDQDKVERFLKRVHCGLSPRTKPLLVEEERTTNNYLFDGDTEDLAKAIDSKWDGALPYTLLVGKDGEVLFRHSGVIDPLALRKKIVEQVWKKSAE